MSLCLGLLNALCMCRYCATHVGMKIIYATTRQVMFMVFISLVSSVLAVWSREVMVRVVINLSGFFYHCSRINPIGVLPLSALRGRALL